MTFPGQGSQAVGMGKELVEAHPCAREIFERADERLNRPLSRLCFEGPEEDLRLTLNTQPALYTTSVAAFEVLRSEGIEPDIVAGHSLGEYSALYAAGVFDFETGLRLVQARGEAMYIAGQAEPGAMAAILNLDDDVVADICRKSSPNGGRRVVPANWNCPGQIVVSGHREAVRTALELAREAGSRRSVLLPVSGAFHSPLVQPAVAIMRCELAEAKMHAPRCRFVANVNARAIDDPGEIVDGLAEQIVSCVLWSKSIQTIVGMQPDLFVEVGPGKVLTGLLRRIDPTLNGLNFGIPSDLEALLPARV